MTEMLLQEMDALTVRLRQISFVLVFQMFSRLVLSNVEMETCKLVQGFMKYVMTIMWLQEMDVLQDVRLNLFTNARLLLGNYQFANWYVEMVSKTVHNQKLVTMVTTQI